MKIGMIRKSESLQDRVGYKSVIDLGREAAVPFPHNLFDYPTKILPQVMGEFVERLSNAGEVVLDPFAGGGTIAVECALRQRRSINVDINPVDINPYALQVAQKNWRLCGQGRYSNRRWWKGRCAYWLMRAHCR